MGPIRSGVLTLFAFIAIYRGWQIRHSNHAWMAFGLGALALGLAAWHLIRMQTAPPRS